MSEHLQKIFDVWDGNAEAMAADIDEKGVTVRQWRNRGDIPSRAAQLKIIKAAFEKDGTILRLEDFLPADVRAELPGHGAEAATAGHEASATNGAEIIGTEEGHEHAPFPDAPVLNAPPELSTGAISPTCSSTSEHPSLPLASPDCSTSGTAEAA